MGFRSTYTCLSTPQGTRAASGQPRSMSPSLSGTTASDTHGWMPSENAKLQERAAICLLRLRVLLRIVGMKLLQEVMLQQVRSRDCLRAHQALLQVGSRWTEKLALLPLRHDLSQLIQVRLTSIPVHRLSPVIRLLLEGALLPASRPLRAVTRDLQKAAL